jgi:hypothetical protein
MTTTTLPLEALISPIRDVDCSLVEPEFRSYTNYAGELVSHSCDDLAHEEWEQGFCDESELYCLTDARDLPFVHKHNGWSYACKRHLRKLVFEFALAIEEKCLDHEFDVYCDKLNEQEQANAR